MQSVFAVCAALFLTTMTAPAGAAGEEPFAPAPQDGASESAPVAPQTRAQKLDGLFASLKRERNEKAARRIADRIRQEWAQSGSASVDLMMQWSQKAIEEKKYDVALDFLDQGTTLAPAYAEGWNRRATAHFLTGNYAKSMADIEQTLELEPRHFGALSGLAQIMADTGRRQAALEAWQRVLDIYPMLRNAQSQVATLSEELAGQGI